MSTIIELALQFAIVFPAIILHEVSHGYVAYLLGDPTAKRAGRLSLNPLVHVDPVGTVILPIAMLIISGGSYFFGWAKPVPINPYRFKDQRLGMLLTGIAGPLTNIALSALSCIILRVAMGFSDGSGFAFNATAAGLLLFFAQANLVLAFFNLIPIPPLDGSRVLQFFLPDRLRDMYHSLERYGFLILIGFSWIVPGAFSGYLALTVQPVLRLFLGL